jgi:hypothetical protein
MSETRLRTLIAEMREVVRDAGGSISKLTVAHYADRLEAALAEGVPPVEPGVPGSEVLCEECAKVFCPHGERLHFHHDGCPACSDDESAGVPPEPSQEQTVAKFVNWVKQTPHDSLVGDSRVAFDAQVRVLEQLMWYLEGKGDYLSARSQENAQWPTLNRRW